MALMVHMSIDLMAHINLVLMVPMALMDLMVILTV
jgi:hypothetical protein